VFRVLDEAAGLILVNQRAGRHAGRHFDDVQIAQGRKHVQHGYARRQVRCGQSQACLRPDENPIRAKTGAAQPGQVVPRDRPIEALSKLTSLRVRKSKGAASGRLIGRDDGPIRQIG